MGLLNCSDLLGAEILVISALYVWAECGLDVVTDAPVFGGQMGRTSIERYR